MDLLTKDSFVLLFLMILSSIYPAFYLIDGFKNHLFTDWNILQNGSRRTLSHQMFHNDNITASLTQFRKGQQQHNRQHQKAHTQRARTSVYNQTDTDKRRNHDRHRHRWNNDALPDVQHFIEGIIKALQYFTNHLTLCQRLNIWEHDYRIMM